MEPTIRGRTTKAIPPEIRAQIESRILVGEASGTIAKNFGVDRSTVERIRRQLKPVLAELRQTTRMPTTAPLTADGRTGDGGLLQPVPVLDIQVRMNEYLEATFDALCAILRYSARPDWLAQQNARDLSEFFGIATDRAVRVLSAIRPAGDEDDPDLPTPLIERRGRG